MLMISDQFENVDRILFQTNKRITMKINKLNADGSLFKRRFAPLAASSDQQVTAEGELHSGTVGRAGETLNTNQSEADRGALTSVLLQEAKETGRFLGPSFCLVFSVPPARIFTLNATFIYTFVPGKCDRCSTWMLRVHPCIFSLPDRNALI